MFAYIPVINRKWLRLTLAILGIGLCYSWAFPATAQATEPVFQAGGVAIRGYDTLAYFTEGRAVRGKEAFQAKWNGATWYFASSTNRDEFLKAPEQYAPQYGGYCAYAVSNNYIASTDPYAWTVYKDKLYLNYSVGVRSSWLGSKDSNIKKGDRNWPGLIGR